MKKFLLLSISACFILNLAASSQENLYKKALNLKKAGNYKDALKIFKELVMEKEKDPRLVGNSLMRAIECMRSLNLRKDIDAFREEAIAKHKNNWRFLQTAAYSFSDQEHYGYMIAGQFERGYHRGGGEVVNSLQRDRTRALQLYSQAMPLVKKEASASEKYTFYQAFARAILYNRGYTEAWRLQYLSDLKKLPDYEPGYYYGSYGGNNFGAPVNPDGSPVYYFIPDSFEAAKNDGERWRWLLNESKRNYPRNASTVDIDFANFLRNQFGVQTMAYYGRNNSGGDKINGPYAVDSLPENETIAKLATGIKRFKLPDEFNFIKIYQRIAELKNHTARQALENLTDIFRNRRQYPKAAKRLEENIKRFGPGYRRSKEKQLKQIVGNWGIFEPGRPLPANKPAEVFFRFRNAKEVSFEAHKINIEKLLRDVKEYLKKNPIKINWEVVNLNNIGYRLVNENESEYLTEKTAEWTLKLNPKKDHLDKRIIVKTPLKEAGAYLLKAKLKDGNISNIVIWLTDMAIARKKIDKGFLYFVADAITGEPVPGAELDFFGYRSEYLGRNIISKITGRKYNVLTKEFKSSTGDNGLAITDKLEQRYNWLTIAKTKEGRLAFMGFNSVWHGRYYDREYNQRKIFCITDRPVYRPGDTMKFKFWIRNAKYDQEDKSNFANMPFTVIIRNPQNEEVFKKTLTSDQFGGINGKFELGQDAALGRYSVYIDNWGGNSYFRVEEYKKPEYEVKIEGPKEPVKLGDKINVTIKAKYYFGAPVTNAKVKYKVLRSNYSAEWFPPAYWDWFYGPGYWWFAYDCKWLPGWNEWGCFRPSPWWIYRAPTPPELVMENETQISPDGTVKITIDSSVAKAFHGNTDSKYEITAEVVDQSRRTIVGKGSAIAARKPFKVYAWVNRGYYKTGDAVIADFCARTVDGKPVKGFGELKLFRVTYQSDGTPQEKLIQTWKLDTNEAGRSSLQLKADDSGQYRLAYTVTDQKSQAIEGAYIFSVRGASTNSDDFRFNAIELVNDRKEYAPGDEAALMINTDRKNSFVLLFARAANGVYLPPETLHLEGKSAFHKMKITKKDMPNIFVEALTISNGRIYTTVKELIVPPEKRVLNVEILPSKEKYKPGEKAKVKVKISDYFGKPVSNSTVMTVYDKSVEYVFGGSNVPEIKKFFWKWRRSHSSQTVSSLDKYFGNVIPRGTITLQTLGVFGNIIKLNGNIATGGAHAQRACYAVKAKKASPRRMEETLACDAAAPVLEKECKSEVSSLKPEGLGGKSNTTVDLDVKIRKNFADTAFWSANITPDKNGIAEIELDMPENLTTWKISAWSMADGTKVGQGSTEVITSKDFIIRLQAPRFFVETDEVVLSAIVHNYHKTEKTAKVALELEGGCMKVMDEKKTPSIQTAKIEPNGEQRIDWRVKVFKEGESVITMKAVTDDDSDAMQMKFPVLVHGILKMVSRTGSIRSPEKEAEETIQIDVPAKRRPEETKFVLNYSPTLAGAMVDALPYLVEYPYGCTEQTLNRFLPTVITQKILKDMGIKLEQIKDKRTNLNAQELGDDKERAKQWKHWKRNPVFDERTVDEMVRKGLKRLAFMQLSDGGWGWFSGYYEFSYPHTTATVVHGLQIARQNGVDVNSSMLNRGVRWLENYQKNELQKLKNAPTKTEPYKTYADNIDALVYMVLTDADKKNDEMKEFLYRDRNHLSVYGKCIFGLALHKQKEQEKLSMIMQNISQYLVEDKEDQTAYLNLQNSGYWWYWYGSEFEAQAYYLKLLSAADPKSDKAAWLVKYLLNNRKHATYWNSTRDTAICIEALADYLKKSGEDKPDMTVEILFDGKLAKTVKITPENLFSFDNSFKLYGKNVSDGKHKITLRRKGSGPLYYNAYLTYFSLEDFIKKAGLEIKVRRNYFKLKKVDKSIKVAGSRGQALDQKVEKFEREKLENLSELKSGDLVEIELVIESKNDYEYLIFEDMKPAGFEPCELRSGYNGNSMGAYVEFRDEKVCFFVRGLARGKHSVSYRMRAEIPGRFSALPTRGYAMYAPELKANSDEIKLKVIDSPEN